MVQMISDFLLSIPFDSALWLIVTTFIILDVFCGTLKAFIMHNLSSEKARKGVLHKAGFFTVMLLSTIIDAAQTIADFGFSVPLLPICSVMIVLCEIYSIAEHIEAMNPDIDLKFLRKGKDDDTSRD